MLLKDLSTSDLLATFGSGLSKHTEIIDKLLSIANVYQLSADDLFVKWEALATQLQSNAKDNSNRNYDLPTLDDVDEIQKRVQRDFEHTAKAAAGIKNTVLHRKEVNPFLENRMFDANSIGSMLENGNFGTPHTGRKKVPLNAAHSAGRSASKQTASSRTTSITPRTPLTARRDFTNFTDPSSPSAKRSSTTNSPFVAPIGSSPIAPSPHAIRFADRLNKAKKEDILNENVPFVGPNPGQPVRCEIALTPGQQLEGYRYMFEKLTEKGDMIDERIDMFADLIIESVRKTLPEADQADFVLAHPAQPTQERLITVGRICCDTIVESAKLNDQSVVLEASRAIGAGCRVKLNLGDMVAKGSGFSLFPGQIVGVEGTNPSGRLINVTRIIYPPLPDPVMASPTDLIRLYPSEDPSPSHVVHVVISAGPYTLDDSLNYEPFEEFVTQMEKEQPQPDVVILLGPFIDSSHSLIVAGEIDESLDALFERQISSRLHRLLDIRQNLKVIIVPSAKDAVSEWCAFPQPPLASGLSAEEAEERRKELGIPSGVLLFPNPVQFTINEIVFAVTSVDILMHLSGEETSRQPKGEKPDRIGRLFRHVLEQRSFYPLHPPHENEACLDLSRARALEVQAVPDVLVLSSGLRFAAKSVDGVVCVNPGGICKGKVGGTFARMCVHPLDMAGIKDLIGGEDRMEVDGEEEVPVRHVVGERCRVEIVRV
ncbi:DNA-directed DNA polymerase alpha subunit pol12 [Rhizophlyctis rosea]|uniref:DNA polymerase alpha subunit B n=1 Tax=Rhizophlyctis rosea TaxID=64517 RepID=A0AAD5X4G2_9FUNG|nr:DNA-directed DNA polymerase alpha subunit pol12 [Rhizophlyctis rosea]